MSAVLSPRLPAVISHTVRRPEAPPAAPVARPPGPGHRWTWFSDFWFELSGTQIQADDEEKLAEVIALLRRQPARRVAIDGVTRERGRDLGRRRIAQLREALLRAGIGAERIVTGELGLCGLRHAQRVVVLIGDEGPGR